MQIQLFCWVLTNFFSSVIGKEKESMERLPFFSSIIGKTSLPITKDRNIIVSNEPRKLRFVSRGNAIKSRLILKGNVLFQKKKKCFGDWCSIKFSHQMNAWQWALRIEQQVKGVLYFLIIEVQLRFTSWACHLSVPLVLLSTIFSPHFFFYQVELHGLSQQTPLYSGYKLDSRIIHWQLVSGMRIKIFILIPSCCVTGGCSIP